MISLRRETQVRWGAIAIGLFVFVLDLLSKWVVTNTVRLQSYPVVTDFFSIQYTKNEGIAFGFLHDFQSEWKSTILASLALLAILMVLYYIRSTPASERLVLVSLGLLLGGILGNFVDRLIHHYVVDFLKLHWGTRLAWPTFNVADAAITCGVLLILCATFFGSSPDPKPERREESLSLK
ncbi:MAG: signal peptidase II [Acidobacteriota bacterium]